MEYTAPHTVRLAASGAIMRAADAPPIIRTAQQRTMRAPVHIGDVLAELVPEILARCERRESQTTEGAAA